MQSPFRYLVLLVALLGLDGGQSLAQPAPDRSIRVDVHDVAGETNTAWRTMIGAGRANEGLRADWQQQLALVRKELGFEYIRMHGLLTDDMGVYKVDEAGKPRYNFQYIDVLYDYLLSIGMKPFVELGFMPAALASGDKTIFWWKGNVTPPNDYDRWHDLMTALVQHFTERYGREEVESWYFEVWNEPNLDGFWAGTQAEYFKLYATTADAIKAIDPAYRVGGPATAGAAWVPETIAFCHDNGVPLDFISTHSYGVKEGFLDEFGHKGTVLDADEWAVSGDFRNSRKEIEASAMPKLPLHYTEWSSSYTPKDPIHDSYHQAAYVLQKLKQAGSAADSLSYWVFTDIFEEAGPRFTPFHGGFGLLNYQGIKKPAYFSYLFLNKLGPTELKNDDRQSWATLKPDGSVQILLWDYTYTLPDGVNDQQFYVRDLPPESKGTVDVEVGGLHKGQYGLTTWRVGYWQNDAHSAYVAMGSPRQLSKAQVSALKAVASGKPAPSEPIEVTWSGVFRKSVRLRENDVVLLVLTPVQTGERAAALR